MSVIPPSRRSCCPGCCRACAASARPEAVPARGAERAAIESLHHGRSDCVLLALPYPTGEVEKETIELDALFVAFPKDDPRDPPAEILARPDRREPAAAARRRALPEGPCAGRLQPPRTARQRDDDRHQPAHAGADGRQWPGPDHAARNGARCGILNGTNVVARPLKSRKNNANREIALVWRKNSPRIRDEFRHAGRGIAGVDTGNTVLVEFWLTGTHLGPLRHAGKVIGPTGKAFRVRMAASFEFAPGRDKILVERPYFDSAMIAKQLGLA
jgi:hypothetical protein